MTDFTYLSAFLFIVVTLAIIVVAVSRRSSENLSYERRHKEQRHHYLRGRFSPDGTIIDQVMLSCLGDSRTRDLFDTKKYRTMGLARRRQEFCALCLEAVYGYDFVVEGVVLSRETRIAFRYLIDPLPLRNRDFYESERPRDALNPETARYFHPYGGDVDGGVSHDCFYVWTHVFLPEDGASRLVRIEELANAVAGGELTLRFRRVGMFETQGVPSRAGEAKRERSPQ